MKKTVSSNDILFIINPNSGKKNPQKTLSTLQKEINPLHYILAPNIAALDTYLQQNAHLFKAFVAVGGDGTIQSLLPYLQNTNKILAVLPNGSGNGFAREMGFSKEISKLMQAFERGETISTDQLMINKNVCINVSGIGFDSNIAHGFNQQKVRGLLTYIRISFLSFFTFKPFEAKIEINQEVISDTYFMITIANTRQFGNNAIISPQSNPTDGKYELVLVKPMPMLNGLAFVWRMFNGNLKPSKYVDYKQVSQSTLIHTSFPKIHVDGDPFSVNGEINITINPRTYQVLKMQ